MEGCCTCLPTWITISLEKSIPGMSSWGIDIKPALWEGTEFPLSIREAGKGFAAFVLPAHAHSHGASPKLPPHWGVSCWHCHHTGERSWETRTNCPLTDHRMVNPVEHLQENTIACICSSHIPIFQTLRNTKAVIFSDNSISHIAISTFTSEQWEVQDLVIKDNKVALLWMLYFWIALGHTALPRSAAEGIPSF